MATLVSQEGVLGILGHYLYGENQVKLEVLNYIINHENHLSKA